MSSSVTDELKGWIGREATYVAPEELGRASIRYFALATEDDNPLYYDEAFARGTRHGGMIAPPTLVCETNQIYALPPDNDFYVGHRWMLPLKNNQPIRGGNEYEFHQAARPDDRITVTWRILDIYERETRQRGPLIFVISEARYVNQRGELIAVNRETTIYQP